MRVVHNLYALHKTRVGTRTYTNRKSKTKHIPKLDKTRVRVHAVTCNLCEGSACDTLGNDNTTLCLVSSGYGCWVSKNSNYSSLSLMHFLAMLPLRIFHTSVDLLLFIRIIPLLRHLPHPVLHILIPTSV